MGNSDQTSGEVNTCTRLEIGGRGDIESFTWVHNILD